MTFAGCWKLHLFVKLQSCRRDLPLRVVRPLEWDSLRKPGLLGPNSLICRFPATLI